MNEGNDSMCHRILHGKILVNLFLTLLTGSLAGDTSATSPDPRDCIINTGRLLLKITLIKNMISIPCIHFQIICLIHYVF